MLPESHTKVMEKTSITNNPSPKVALIVGLISEWSLQEQIEVLQETLMEVSNLKHRKENEAALKHQKERNDWLRDSTPRSVTLSDRRFEEPIWGDWTQNRWIVCR